jgi:uncharacterized phage infection (PIP) family protein YhgE
MDPMTGDVFAERIQEISETPIQISVSSANPVIKGAMIDCQIQLLGIAMPTTEKKKKRIPDNEMHSARCECDACKPY